MFGSLLFELEDAWPTQAGTQVTIVDQAAIGLASGGPIARGIADLAFLVGGVWVTQSGSTSVGERVEWGAGHSCLLTEVTQVVAGKVAGLARGTFGYSPAKQYLMSNALSSTGSYTAGYQTGAPDATTWVFAMLCGSGAQVMNVQVTMKHPAPDQLVIAQAIQQSGAWVPQSSTTYHRQLLTSRS